MADTNKTISSPEDFKSRQESIVTLSDYDSFGEYYELNVRVKKVNMQSLVVQGVIPNSLLQKAIALKDPNRKNKNAKIVEQKITPDLVKDSLEAMRALAKAVVVDPEYEKIKDYLTDSHLSQIASYVTGGVKELERFRNEQESARRNNGSGEVQLPTQ